MKNKSGCGCGFLLFAGFLVFLTFFGGLLTAVLSPLFVVVFGWVSFLIRTLPQVEVSWRDVLYVGLCSTIALAGIHSFCGWFYRHWKGADAVWPRRLSFIFFAAIWLVFAGIVAVTGVMHQTGWLISSKEPWLTEMRSRDHMLENEAVIAFREHVLPAGEMDTVENVHASFSQSTQGYKFLERNRVLYLVDQDGNLNTILCVRRSAPKFFVILTRDDKTELESVEKLSEFIQNHENKLKRKASSGTPVPDPQ